MVKKQRIKLRLFLMEQSLNTMFHVKSKCLRANHWLQLRRLLKLSQVQPVADKVPVTDISSKLVQHGNLEPDPELEEQAAAVHFEVSEPVVTPEPQRTFTPRERIEAEEIKRQKEAVREEEKRFLPNSKHGKLRHNKLLLNNSLWVCNKLKERYDRKQECNLVL